VSAVIVLLLDTFAEVLCFELGRCSRQLFVNYDMSLNLLTFNATLNLITAMTLSRAVDLSEVCSEGLDTY
jgi:hypothetical protein